MAIDDAEVRRTARLARLKLEPAAASTLARELQSILDHVAVLDELELDSIPPTASLPGNRPLREDTERPSLSTDDALRNAPDHAAGHFRVPRVLAE